MRVLCGSMPFAIRSIAIFDDMLENCDKKHKISKWTVTFAKNKSSNTYAVPDEHLRPLRDEHVQRLRDVLLLGGQHEVPAARDVRPGVSRP